MEIIHGLQSFASPAADAFWHAVTTLGAQALKLVVGIVGVMALLFALKAVLPETDLADFLRYFVMGLWTGWLAPLIFRRIVSNQSIAPQPSFS